MKKSPTAVFVVLSFSVFGLFLILFDGYVNQIAKESLMNWIKSEDAAVMEGNLLTSVTKNQKVLLSSEFIKGVAVFDISSPRMSELIVVGDKIELTNEKLIGSSAGIDLVRAGLFKRYAVAKIPNQDDLVIAFSIWSKNLNDIFYLSCFIFIGLFGISTVVINRIQLAKSRLATQYAEKAARAAHDIGSPLFALSAAIDDLKDIDDDRKEKLLVATQCIREIANDLFETRADGIQKLVISIDPPAKETNLIRMTLVQELDLIIENLKREHAEKSQIKIEFENNLTSSELKLRFSTSELRRHLANLIRNSVDALENGGVVLISLKNIGAFLEVKIQDDGIGIPAHAMNRIGEKGITYRKSKGSGIGLYAAKNAIENSDGKFHFESIEGQGTTVTMEIPVLLSMENGISTIALPKESIIYVVDDDACIHSAWQTYFKSKALEDKNIVVRYFYDPKKFLKDVAGEPLSDALVLSDFDLKTTMDGIDMISQSTFLDRSILITGMARDENVVGRASKLGLPIISKDNLTSIQFVQI